MDQCMAASPELLKLLPESLGSKKVPVMPDTKARADAKAKAGRFPWPKIASHGPAPRAIITYIIDHDQWIQ